jgi:hypothetical protein
LLWNTTVAPVINFEASTEMRGEPVIIFGSTHRTSRLASPDERGIPHNPCSSQKEVPQSMMIPPKLITKTEIRTLDRLTTDTQNPLVHPNEQLAQSRAEIDLSSLGSSKPEGSAAIETMGDDPFVWDRFDQEAELAHLRLWLPKVESRPGREPLCRALGELMQQGLVRYGTCRGEKGFGVITEWAALEGWATEIFYPADPVGWGIVSGLCNPRFLLVGTGYSRGKYDLVFVSLLAVRERRTPTRRRCKHNRRCQ